MRENLEKDTNAKVDKLTIKVIVIGVVSVLIPLLLSSLLILLIVTNYLNQTAKDTIVTTTDINARYIEEKLKYEKEFVISSVQYGAIIRTAALDNKKAEYFKNICNNSGYEDFFYVSKDKKVTSITEYSNIQFELDDKLFKEALEGTTSSTITMLGDGKAYLVVYTPVITDEKIDGIIVAPKDILTIYKELAIINDSESTKVYIAHKDGQILASEAIGQIGKTIGDLYRTNAKDSDSSLDTLKNNLHAISTATGEDNLIEYEHIADTDLVIISSMLKSDITDSIKTLRIYVCMSYIVMILIALLIFYNMANMLTKPLNLLSKRFKALSELRIYDTDDELDKYKDKEGTIGILTRALLKTEDTIKGFVDNLQDISKTLIVESNNLLSLNTNSNSIVKEVVDSITVVANSATEQVNIVDTTKNAVDTISEKLEVEKNMIEEATRLAVSTTNAIEKGENYMKSLVEDTNKALESFNIVNEDIINSNIQANDIKKVINIIKNITTQTNLLAINAKIYASKAGDHGKGFNVIADEIRKLADETKLNSALIQHSIETLIKLSEETVDSITETKESLNHQIKSVKNTNKVFVDIKTIADEYNDKVHKIDNMARGIDIEKRKIESSIGFLAGIAEENAALSEELSAASEEILNNASIIQDRTHNLDNLAKSTLENIEIFNIK